MKRAKPSYLEAPENSVDRLRRPRPTKGTSWDSLLAERQSRVALEEAFEKEEEESPSTSYRSEDDQFDELPAELPATKDEETVKVCLRLRPYSQSHNCNLKIRDSSTLVVKCAGENQPGASSEKHFTFSNVFDDHVSQAEVYDSCIRPTIRLTSGEPGATILTYGTSGSGKTYTLLGNAEQPGIVPRSIEQIYEELRGHVSSEPMLKMEGMQLCPLSDGEMIEEKYKVATIKDMLRSDSHEQISQVIQSQQQFQPLELGDRRVFIWISFVEIYNENVYDLLNLDEACAKRKPLKVLANEGNAYIKGLSTLYASTKEEAYNLLEYGLQSATYGSTDVNCNSSRSHSIFTMNVITHSLAMQQISQSVYKFCDLAGSERQKKTGTMANRLKEAQKINNSLLVLGRCLETVHRNQKPRKVHDLVPVRDSKLTMIIQSALLGKEPMTMIVNVHPTDEFYDENINVLNFSSIAKQIVIRKPSKMPNNGAESTRYSFLPTSAPDLLVRENEALKLEVQQLRDQLEHSKKTLFIQEYQLRNELTDNFKVQFDKMEDSYQQRIESAKQLAILPYKQQLIVLQRKLESKEREIQELEDELEEDENKLKAYEEEINLLRLSKGKRRLSL
ncbi:kinesin-like protein subito [Anopheles darlingi]|uniref:kinesin-like protein subito n=1 Tax=Anopheles darlingi TaxID=43151 RepID=UPI00210033FD|nr:kinesin-like protein subito [Anopheles darlingi]